MRTNRGRASAAAAAAAFAAPAAAAAFAAPAAAAAASAAFAASTSAAAFAAPAAAAAAAAAAPNTDLFTSHGHHSGWAGGGGLLFSLQGLDDGGTDDEWGMTSELELLPLPLPLLPPLPPLPPPLLPPLPPPPPPAVVAGAVLPGLAMWQVPAPAGLPLPSPSGQAHGQPVATFVPAPETDTHTAAVCGLLCALLRTPVEQGGVGGTVAELPKGCWNLLLAPPAVLSDETNGHPWLRALLFHVVGRVRARRINAIDGGCFALRVLGIAGLMSELVENVLCLRDPQVYSALEQVCVDGGELYSIWLLAHPEHLKGEPTPDNWPGLTEGYGTGILHEEDTEMELQRMSARLAALEGLAQATVLLAGSRTPVARVAQLFERNSDGNIVARPAAILIGTTNMLRHLAVATRVAVRGAESLPALAGVVSRLESVGLTLVHDDMARASVSGGGGDEPTGGVMRGGMVSIEQATVLQQRMRTVAKAMQATSVRQAGYAFVWRSVARACGEESAVEEGNQAALLAEVPSALLPCGNIGDGLGNSLADMLRPFVNSESSLPFAMLLGTLMFPLRRMAQEALAPMLLRRGAKRRPNVVAPELLQNPEYVEALGGDMPVPLQFDPNLLDDIMDTLMDDNASLLDLSADVLQELYSGDVAAVAGAPPQFSAAANSAAALYLHSPSRLRSSPHRHLFAAVPHPNSPLRYNSLDTFDPLSLDVQRKVAVDGALSTTMSAYLSVNNE